MQHDSGDGFGGQFERAVIHNIYRQESGHYLVDKERGEAVSVAATFSQLNHHPDWSNVYNVLTIKLSTHDADGVTKKDFKLAKAIEYIVEPDEE